jgi:hypothetical protein
MDGELLYAASWLVIAGIAVVVWLASRDGLAGGLGRLGIAALAGVATTGAIALARSDVSRETIAAAVSGLGALALGLFALAMWGAFVASAWRWWRGRRVARDPARARAARRRADVALAVSLVACLVGSVSGLYRAGQARSPQASGIVDARLAPDGRRLWSLGADGELLEWRLVALPGERAGLSAPSPYRVARRHRLPVPPADARLAVTLDGSRVATLSDSTVNVYSLAAGGGDAHPVAALQGIRFVAAAGDAFVVASSRGLERIAERDPGLWTALAWPEPIVALAASARGEVVFADATGRFLRAGAGGAVPLAELPGPVRTLAFDATGDRLLVAFEKTALAIDARTGASTALGGETADLITPAGGTRMLLCHGQAVSCTSLDLVDGRRSPGFSGVLKEYARVEGAPGAALLVSAESLYVHAIGTNGQGYGGAFLRDPRF